MPPTDLAEEPLSLAKHAKQHFQPEPPPREVKSRQEEPSAPAPEQPAAPAKPAPAAKEKPPEPKKDEPKVDPPASEDEAVFGTQPAKAAKEKAAAPNDEDFKKEVAEETKGMTDKAQEKWVKMRLAEKAAKEDAAAARAELAAAAEARQAAKVEDQTPQLEALRAELEAAKAQLAEADKALSVTQVERSKRYRQTVTEPMQELTQQAESIATRYEVSSKDLLKALNEEPATRATALKELAAEFEEADRVELYTIAKDMDRLRRTGEKLKDRAKEDLSVLEEEERAIEERTVKEMRQALGASAQRAWDEASSTFDFLNANPHAPEWTAALANARTQSENWVPGQDAVSDGRIRAHAAQHPFLVKALQHKDKTIAAQADRLKELEERFAQDNATDPALGGQRDGEDAIDEDDGEGLSIGQRVKAAAASGKL